MGSKQNEIEVQRRVERRFAENFLDDIKVQRIKAGTDRKLIADSRIFAGMRRHPLIHKIKEDLINADLERDMRNK